ncbi:hypothetical protein AGR1A_Cc30072 [Agrobacterium fabacearum CFBP 5771]|nr:hypothetical protein AGR1C_Cc11168 [Agrobacterium fabacearum TT111]CUW96851.1 hypothetical protein AGR1B_Cc90081 [Agrobacterium fabacearum S56]CVI16486.1 hypothetical protein AGR1A_Cc30072 [Agrobacterium fabacearum CFBP 5771]
MNLKSRPPAAGRHGLSETLRVDGVLQALACGKLRYVASRDIDFSTRGRVTTLGGFTTAYGEAAEASETDVATALQFVLYGFEYGINSGSSICLRETSLFGNSRDELVLVHVSTPFNGLKRLKLSRRRIRLYPRAATQKRWNRLKNKGSAGFFTKKADISAGLSLKRANFAPVLRASKKHRAFRHLTH